MVNWIKRVRPWITLLAEIATIVGVFGIAALIFLKKAVVDNLGWIIFLTSVLITLFFRKKVLKFFIRIKDKITNKPLIDKLQTKIKELQDENKNLSNELNNLKTNISKMPDLKTYYYDLKNYENMDWKITLRYRLDADKKLLPHVDVNSIENPYCPRCGTSLSPKDIYNALSGDSVLWFTCPKKCGFFTCTGLSMIELRDNVEKVAISDFKKEYQKLIT